MTGCFITFEGVEGSGKSTQIRLLAARLARLGRTVTLTREPGGCPIADRVRSILLDPASRGMVPRAELLLYAAARAQHVAEIIRPSLERGDIVLCDRFSDATLAYQGRGRGLDLRLVETLNVIATDGLEPDLTLLLDLPAREGLQRACTRHDLQGTGHEGRFEEEELAFHQRVRSGYLELARHSPRCRLIDASGSESTVAARILTTVVDFLEQR